MSHLILAGTYVPFGTGKNTLNSGDTAWVLASSALVLLMTPALAFFYGGMVRVKHVLAMLMQNFASIAIVSVTWVIVGFTWAFGGTNAWLGGPALLRPAAHERRRAGARTGRRRRRRWRSWPSS